MPSMNTSHSMPWESFNSPYLSMNMERNVPDLHPLNSHHCPTLRKCPTMDQTATSPSFSLHSMLNGLFSGQNVVDTSRWIVPPPQQLYELMQKWVNPSETSSGKSSVSYLATTRLQQGTSRKVLTATEATVQDLSLNRTLDKWEAGSELNISDPGTFGTLPSPSTNSSPTEVNSTLMRNLTPKDRGRRHPYGTPHQPEIKPPVKPLQSPNIYSPPNLRPSSFANQKPPNFSTEQSGIHPKESLSHAHDNQQPCKETLHRSSKYTPETLPYELSDHSNVSLEHVRQQSMYQYYMYILQQYYYTQYQNWIRSLNQTNHLNNTPSSEFTSAPIQASLGQACQSPGKSNPTAVNLVSSFSVKQSSTSTKQHKLRTVKKDLSGKPLRRTFPCNPDCSKISHSSTHTSPSDLPVSSIVWEDPTANYACKLCNKTYSQASALKMHVRTHTLPCRCAHCGKSFSRKWLLKGHERTHTGERPYACTVCGRSFADRSNLRAHMQTHQRDKRYTCCHCPRSFSRMGLLNKHLLQCLGPTGYSVNGSIPSHVRSKEFGKTGECGPSWLDDTRSVGGIRNRLNFKRH
ncbi:hypothetical protein EG68_03064 [Paragonimus skrjabini miyazakii]|uniref:C2H2-type domain-containing protein n=1 Tax=Paragonimus skrjabini miyazakii TaxID=59628 RepID=A0A8S9Z941_9TREM|nr:hypothetical protein EG68_03064 [Paragonimus skrjabini miyazakii]